MADNEAKAKAMVAEAQKKMSSSKGDLFGLYGLDFYTIAPPQYLIFYQTMSFKANILFLPSNITRTERFTGAEQELVVKISLHSLKEIG